MKGILEELVLEADDKIDLYQAPRLAIEETLKKPCTQNKCKRNLNVFIVAAPCNGFGDVIFATKFARYIRYGLSPQAKPYSTNVTIITPTVNMFQQLGISGIKLVELKGKRLQCRRLKNYNRPTNLGKADLIFVAPLMTDFTIDYSDVKQLFKESTPFNTIFLSEYQPTMHEGYDFLTGVGKEFDGLLFDGLKPVPKPKIIGNVPYAMSYIAKDVGIPYCLSNFIKMIVQKYHKKYPNLQIVVPGWVLNKIKRNVALKKFINKFYQTIKYVDKESVTGETSKNTLIFRADIFPVPRNVMLSLMKHSINDILVTGDQSLTDVLDCCPKKTIWYQSVPWKKTLTLALAKELPQKYFASSKTSCGTLKAISWNRGSGNFKKRHDFRKKAKHRLDAIFRAVSEAKIPNSTVNRYLAQLNKSASKKALIKSIYS